MALIPEALPFGSEIKTVWSKITPLYERELLLILLGRL